MYKFFEGDFVTFLWITLGVVAFLTVAVLAISFICYRIAFYAPPRKSPDPDYVPTPRGKLYDPYREQMKKWVLEARAMPSEEFTIKSFDGLTLYARYYEYAPGVPIELMHHGYRGNSESDLSGGVQRCFLLGQSAFIIDVRCGGKSEGNTITFGIRESKDTLAWIDFMIDHFGQDVKIILTGISMGAATVMTAAGEKLPKNVIGVLADCGFSSPEAIIKKVIKDMKIPPSLAFPFVRLGARLFGGFDIRENSAIEAVKRATVPMIFFHGEADDFVPSYMSRECYDACPTRKKLVMVPSAGHGLAYPVDKEGYLSALRDFWSEEYKKFEEK